MIRHTKSKLHLNASSKINIRPGNRITKHVKVISSEAKIMDLMIAAHIACHSSITSVDHLGELLNNLKITSRGNCIRQHRTKCTALIKNVIYPSLLEDLLEDVGDAKYSLIVDESTDVATKKYLCLCIRYFSAKQCKVKTDFLGLIEVEKVTAEQLYLTLTKYLKTLKLEVKNLVGLGTDGANNLCGKKNSLFTLLRADSPNLQIVKCICHSLNNAASKASELLPRNLDFMCREIFNWFHCSPLRRAEYKHLFDTFNKNEKKTFHNFVQLSATRWLCRYNVINIIIEHYEELKVYFNAIIVDKEKSYSALLLKDMLNDKKNLLYLICLKPILHEVNKLNLTFQKNFIEIGKAHSDIQNLILFLAKKIMKPIFTVTNSLELIIKNLDNELAFAKPTDAHLGIEYCREVKKSGLNAFEIEGVDTRMCIYIKSLLEECCKRLPDNIDHFKKLEYFSPSVILSQTCCKDFESLPFLNMFASEKDIFKIENQYDIIKNVQWKDLYGSDVLDNSYKFWETVKNHKDAVGRLVFTELANFVVTLLSLPSSNATVERIFSIMNIVKNKMRNRMSLPLLNSIIQLRVFFFTQNICCKSFNPSKKMIQKFTNRMYNSDYTEETDEDVLSLQLIVEEDTEYPVLSIDE